MPIIGLKIVNLQLTSTRKAHRRVARLQRANFAAATRFRVLGLTTMARSIGKYRGREKSRKSQVPWHARHGQEIVNHILGSSGNSPAGATGITLFRALSNAEAKQQVGEDGYDQIGSRRHRRGSRPVHHSQRHPAFCAVQLPPGGECRRVARNHLIDTTMKEAALSGAQRSPEDMRQETRRRCSGPKSPS